MNNPKETVQNNLKNGQIIISGIERGEIGAFAGPLKVYRWCYGIFSWKPKVIFGVLILGILFCVFAFGDFISAASVQTKIDERFAEIDANSGPKLIADIAWEKTLAYQEIGHPDRIREKAWNGLSMGLWMLIPSLLLILGSKKYLRVIGQHSEQLKVTKAS